MPWPKSKSASEKKASKAKSTPERQQHRQQIVISMPKIRREFGMGTFGTETSDTVGMSTDASVINTLEHESRQGQEQHIPKFTSTILPRISDQKLYFPGGPLSDSSGGCNTVSTESQNNDLPVTTTPKTNTETAEGTTLGNTGTMSTVTGSQSVKNSSNPLSSQQQLPQRQGSATSPGILSLLALQQQTASNVRRDQSIVPLKTPGGTPATPNSAGVMTPHSVQSQTSYFPATPVSGRTFATSSTNFSSRSNATAAFGGGTGVHQQYSHQQQDAANCDNGSSSNNNNSFNNNNNNSGLSGASTSAETQPTITRDKIGSAACTTTAPTAVVPETRRQRHQRPDILPPAIITNPSAAHSQAQNQGHRAVAAHRHRHQPHHHHPCCSASQTPCTPHAHLHPHHAHTASPLTANLPFHRTANSTYHGFASAVSAAPMSGGESSTAEGTPWSYPVSTPTTSVATPRTPSSMSEWRMMQLQLQQQDDLNFSLTLPSVSALSLSIPPSSRMMSPASSSAFGVMHPTHMAGESGSMEISTLSTSCTSGGCCCGNNSNNANSIASTFPHARSGGISANAVQSPVSATPTFGTGDAIQPQQRHHHHSFLLSPSFPRNTMIASAAVTADIVDDTTPGPGAGTETGMGSGLGSTEGNTNQGGSRMCRQHSNQSFHSRYFFSSDVQPKDLVDGEGQGQGQDNRLRHERGLESARGVLGGSTATLQSEYAPSSVDPSEFEQLPSSTSQNNNYPHHLHPHYHHHQHSQGWGGSTNESTSCGPSSAGSEAPSSQFLNNDAFMRFGPPAPTSAFGSNSGINSSSKAKHCRKCHHHYHHSTGAINSSEDATPASATPALRGSTYMAASGSSTSLTGYGQLNMTNQRPASPAPSQGGSLKSLSTKLAANTLKKLSVSQRSLFSSSKEDLLAGGGSSCNSGAECMCYQHEDGLLQDNSSEAGGSGTAAGCCRCYCTDGGSICSENNPATNNVFSGCSKVQRMQSKINGLRGVSGSKRGRSKERDKDKKSSRKSREVEHSYPSHLVRQEFAQYNYERQIEDFQRAARVFKEQKALTTAATTASITATEIGKGKKAQALQQQQYTEKSFSSSATSLGITPIQETTEEEDGSNKCLQADYKRHSRPIAVTTTTASSCKNSTDNLHSTSDQNLDSGLKGRKKSSARTGLLRSVSRPHRRVGSSNDNSGTIFVGGLSITAKDPTVSTELLHRKSYSCNNISVPRGSFGLKDKGLRGSRTESSLLDLGFIDVSSNADLKLPPLAFDIEKDFDPFNTERSSINVDVSALDIRTAAVEEVNFEDIPLIEMTKLTFSTKGDVNNITSRQSNVSNATRREFRLGSNSSNTESSGNLVGATGSTGGAGFIRQPYNNLKTGRSVHSVCSVDTVSQQISARHHQHSLLAAAAANSLGSNVGSLNSQSLRRQAFHQHSICDSIGAGPTTGSGGGAGEGDLGGATDPSVILENSPIQVVRATVGTVDDPLLPCFTFRMWVLSTVFVVMGAAISEYNFFRSNSAYFSIYFVQLASYFCGKAMARCLPTREFDIRVPGSGWVIQKWESWSTSLPSSPSQRLQRQQESVNENEVGVDSENSNFSESGRRVTGNQTSGGPIRPTNRRGLSRSNITRLKTESPRARKSIGWRFSLNPGKFNMKEHMLIGIAAAAGCSPAYATNVLAIQSLVFSSPLGNLTGVGLVVSSQCIGFSMAWLLFDYVIKPSIMIWPSTLVNVSLYNTLHEHKVLTRWFTRMQLFWYAFFAIFIYQWLPRMFMPVLASMALLCWINPSSNVLRKLGSGYTGLGMGCISLDWSIISGVGPLYTPWWAQCNFFVGLIGMLWIVTPLVYFSDYWAAMSYPIVSSNLYDNSSQLYDISKIVNKDLSFNVTMYDSYSPVVMTPYFAITYGTSFMAVIATFVHVSLFYGSDIWLIAKTRFTRRMQRYKEQVSSGSLARIFQTLLTDLNYSTGQAEAATRTPTGEHSTIRDVHGPGPESRRTSDSTPFRNDITVDSGNGSGIGGLGSISGLSREERVSGGSFYQSSHYRQLSQHQDCFSAPTRPLSGNVASQKDSKQVVDDRDQIPTEMFGTEDIHTSLMRAYPEIPGWWFGAMFVVCFLMAVFVCNAPEIHLPVHALILALLLAAVFALPMAIIQALSSSQIGLNVLSEVVCGYLLPGNQLGNSVFKCYSYMALYQCLNMTQGFKLGHYMKVPPRKIFIAVVYGTLVGAFVNLQVLEWVLLYNRQALFDADPRSGWSFRNMDLFFSASLLWGAISPKRLFAQGSAYYFLPYCFLLGILLPIPFYLMYRFYPPYGAMCKGSSWPFLPKCRCPPSHIAAASQAGSESIAMVYPNPYRTRNQDDFDGVHGLESGTLWTGRLFGMCRSARKVHHQRRKQPRPLQQEQLELQKQEEADLSDKCISSGIPHSSVPTDYRQSNTLSSNNNNNSNGTDIPTTAPIATATTAANTDNISNPGVSPHVYYGNPDSSLDHRLRRFPWHLINTPLICVGASFVPQAPASFVVSAGVVAFCFAFLVLRYRHEWWRRYTFVLAAALDSGTQICNMAIFVVFSLILKGAVEFPSWFGNDATNPEKCGVGDGYN